MSEKNIKVYYKIFKLLENGQIDNNCLKSDFCYSNAVMSKIDIEILLNSANTTLLIQSIEKLKEKLHTINGVKDISDNTVLGQSEYKYIINSYGKQLGLTDSNLANAISNFFLEKEQANTFNEDGIIKITTKSTYKDSLNELKNFYIPLDNKQFVQLKEVVDFKIERNFEEIEKINGQIYKKVLANVDNNIINSTEVLNLLEEHINTIKNDGVNINFGGEKEKSEKIQKNKLKN